MRRLLVLLLVPISLAAQAPPAVPLARHWDLGLTAWDTGKYVDAIGHLRALVGPGAARPWIDSVAVLTGERFRTVELSPDGGRPVWSLDGSTLVYEMGRGGDGGYLTRVVRRESPATVLVQVIGSGAALSPSGALLAWMPPSRGGPGTIEVRDIPGNSLLSLTGLEGWRPTGVTFGADENTMFIVATRAGDGTRNQILRAERTAAGFAVQGEVAPSPGFKGVPVVLPGGRHVVAAALAGNPVRLPTGAAGLRTAGAFFVIDLQANTSRRIEGRAPTVSADGSTIAWIEAQTVVQGNSSIAMSESRLLVAPIGGGAPTVVWMGTQRIDAPALSPDGSRIAFQMMPREDWELYVKETKYPSPLLPVQTGTQPVGEKGNPTRLTREIQHDLLPVWLDGTRILAVVGEARHRRSYLYDAATGARTRLFHNNTVRTIAPEYEWLPSPDGTAILTVAERDGNTVSVERGLYLTDLGQAVSREDVVVRLDAMRAGELALRDKGLALFRPIAPRVQAVTSQVEVGRIYQYEKSLFDFDSKHISQPGNALATAYLDSTFRSFGLEVRRQYFAPRGALGDSTANVLAILPGTTNPELVYIVSSHFDSRAEGPGADDNTSGTAALLEAARVMAKHPQPATILFALFTGEESGLIGSREWVRQAVRDSVRLMGALNNDMIGFANDHRLDNTIRYSNPGIRDIQHAAAMQFSNLITYDALYYKNTDAAAYYEAYGDIVGGIGSYPVLGNPHYHMPHDVLETINHQLVAEVSKTTVATLMLLASSPSRLKGLAVANGTVTWTPSPEQGITGYLVTWGPADAPERNRTRVTQPRAQIAGLQPGMVVQVKAVNARGMEGWDWARTVTSDQ